MPSYPSIVIKIHFSNVRVTLLACRKSICFILVRYTMWSLCHAISRNLLHALAHVVPRLASDTFFLSVFVWSIGYVVSFMIGQAITLVLVL